VRFRSALKFETLTLNVEVTTGLCSISLLVTHLLRGGPGASIVHVVHTTCAHLLKETELQVHETCQRTAK
jgi:hypothetical protein